MVLAVRADGVAGVVDAAHRGGISPRLAADQEERRLDALRRQNVQDPIGIMRQRPIVEGEHHLPVGEWQGLPVLHLAKPEIFAGADHQLTAYAQRIRFARTHRPRRCRAADQCKRDTEKNALHFQVPLAVC